MKETYREQSEEERQLQYFHQGEAIDKDYILDLNPGLKHYFGVLLDDGVAVDVPVEVNGELRHLVQLTDDPELEPRIDPNDEREWTESF